eukprot:403335349
MVDSSSNSIQYNPSFMMTTGETIRLIQAATGGGGGITPTGHQNQQHLNTQQTPRDYMSTMGGGSSNQNSNHKPQKSMDFSNQMDLNVSMTLNMQLDMSIVNSDGGGTSTGMTNSMIKNDSFTDEQETLQRFFNCLSKLNFLECKQLLSSQTAGIHDQLKTEGQLSKEFTKQYVQILHDLMEFDKRYYSFSYLVEDNARNEFFQKCQDLRFKLEDQSKHNKSMSALSMTVGMNVTMEQSQSQLFLQKLIQILSEMDCYIRLKSLMMINYHELYKNRNDMKLLQEIKDNQRKLEIGPSVFNHGFANRGNRTGINMVGSSGKLMPPPKYEWTKEMKKLRDHLSLEFKTLEQLFRCKRAALCQDHITALMCIKITKECLKQRNHEFYEKGLRDQHNQYNNLWKWLMNLQLILIARNRLLLNTFMSNEEKFVRYHLAQQQKDLSISKCELIKIQKIKEFTMKHTVQRVDILLKADDARAALKFKFEYLMDQCWPQGEMETRIIKYKDYSQYINLYSCTSPGSDIPLDMRIVIEKHAEFQNKPTGNLRRDLLRFTKDGLKYSLGMFDEAHYLLITSVINQNTVNDDPYQKQQHQLRLDLLYNLQMDKYYKTMNQWQNNKNCF